jgi:hypothetical protein
MNGPLVAIAIQRYCISIGYCKPNPKSDDDTDAETGTSDSLPMKESTDTEKVIAWMFYYPIPNRKTIWGNFIIIKFVVASLGVNFVASNLFCFVIVSDYCLQLSSEYCIS